MGRYIFLTWVFFMLFLMVNIGEGIGVGWGRLASQKLLPSAVADIVLANGMEKVKLFSTNPSVLIGFSKSNIRITTTLSNGEVYLANTAVKAEAWVKENITNFITMGVDIRSVLLGNEPFTIVNSSFVPDEHDEIKYVNYIPYALEYVSDALNKSSGGKMKASVPHFSDVLIPNIEKPSEGDFRDDIKDVMIRMLHNLDKYGAPFVVNLYPHFSIREKGYPLEFAFFEGNKTFTIKDGNITYTNVFDVTFDAFVWALRKNGFPNMDVVVSQVGWPTDGDLYANVTMAERFHRGLLKKLSSNKGTPLHPAPLDITLFNLVDENSRSPEPRGYAERHYGLYGYDGTPKFDFNFNVGGPERKLEPAQGVSYMPQRWCVYNSDNPPLDPIKYGTLFNKTCNKADCSSLMYGGSCNGVLDKMGNLSYAFNMFFQNRNQKVLEGACDFQGYGKVVATDPSNGTCKFPLQILSTLFIGGKEEMKALASGGWGPSVGIGMLFFGPLLYAYIVGVILG